MSRAKGFALAVVLWTIAGMSLLVAAVIHFAQADVDMVEMRMQEAKGRALVRGAALLMAYEPLPAPGQNDADEALPERRFSFSGVELVVSVMDPSGLLSLNSASQEEFAALLVSTGTMSQPEANVVAEAFLDYRTKNPLLDAVQLLEVPGVSKQTFDRLRKWVHTLGSASWSPGAAPSELQTYLAEAGFIEESTPGNKPTPGNSGGPKSGVISSESGSACTALTFDCLDSQQLGGGAQFGLFQVDVTRPELATNRHWVWVSLDGAIPTILEQSAFPLAKQGG